MTNSTRPTKRALLFLRDTKENQQDYFLIPSEVLDRCRITPEEASIVVQSAEGAAPGDDTQGHVGVAATFMLGMAASLTAQLIWEKVEDATEEVYILEGIKAPKPQ